MNHLSRVPTQRFSSRVDDYVRYRPGYPKAFIQMLVQECGVTSTTVVADIGAGTGISTDLFLQLGCNVFAVEPNQAMRQSAEARLKGVERFHSVPATAESTTLPDQSIDCIAAGQAFHWFDQSNTQREFSRILRPEGFVVLFWNRRLTETSPFLIAYEHLLKTFGTDYHLVNHRQVTASSLSQFFIGPIQHRTFPNQQILDYAGIKGRLLSCSYVPEIGHPTYNPMMVELDKIFHCYAAEGQVCLDYETEVYIGKV